MRPLDLGLTHIALPVSDLDRSVAFYRDYAHLEVVHRAVSANGRETAWVTDLTRSFVVKLMQAPAAPALGRLSGWSHLGVGCLSTDEVDERVARAAAESLGIIGPIDDGPPDGYWAIIIDPDGHNLELSFGQTAFGS